jgi:DNA repair protein RAD7
MSDTHTVISVSGAVDQSRRSSSLVFKQLKTNTTLANIDENRFWVSTIQQSGAESPGFEQSRGEDYATSSEYKGKRNLDLNVGFSGFEDELEGGKGSDDKEVEKILMSSGSVEVGVEMLEELTRSGDAAGGVKRKRCSREEKGKQKLVEVDEELDGEELVILDEEPSSLKRWRASREERENRKLVMDDLVRSGIDLIDLDSEPETENSVYDSQGRTENKADQCKITVSDVSEEGNIRGNESKEGEYRQRFREVARQQAKNYAVFNENHRSLGAESEGTSSSLKIKSTNVNWVPRSSQDHHRSKPLVPSLLELSIKILVKNTDAITSLEGVPDEVKNRLSQLACDSRRMNTHFFYLLVRGSPAEIRVRDCSWLTEEEFTKSFEDCDTKHLMVCFLFYLCNSFR